MFKVHDNIATEMILGAYCAAHPWLCTFPYQAWSIASMILLPGSHVGYHVLLVNNNQTDNNQM